LAYPAATRRGAGTNTPLASRSADAFGRFWFCGSLSVIAPTVRPVNIDDLVWQSRTLGGIPPPLVTVLLERRETELLVQAAS
jgi:hypothetical protein